MKKIAARSVCLQASMYFALLAVLAAAQSITIPVFASDNINVFVNDKPLHLEDSAVIQDNRVLVPMRPFYKALGANVVWDKAANKAAAVKNKTEVVLRIGSKKPTVNGETVAIDAPAKLLSGRTYVPLRFVGESLGEEVHWDATTRTIAVGGAAASSSEASLLSKERKEKIPVQYYQTRAKARTMVSLEDVFNLLNFDYAIKNGEKVIAANHETEYAIDALTYEGLEKNHDRYYMEKKEYERFEIGIRKTGGEHFGVSYRGEEPVITEKVNVTEKVYPFVTETVTRIPILTYHEIGEPPAGAGDATVRLHVSESEFRRQLDWIKENGFNTVTMQEVIAHWDDGKPILDNPVVLSFDDGYASMYETVYPLLLERDMVGSFYVIANYRWDDRFLSGKQMKKMHANGMEIQSHSLSHRPLTTLSRQEMKRELCRSQEFLENLLGHEASIFCYPYGSVNQTVKQQVKACAYSAALGTGHGIASKYDGRFNLNRIYIIYWHSVTDFASILNSAYE